ncbi:receptor-type tyrosine-protein phosphatase-like N isoform X2 [Stegostoma tigrinum]|uniref:receptor-type tyrosine-protein phosphatase-like N isoform X2 n=1 Tax=Stegostoma tigrinum TaxID=3053191 RepID=UPI002870A48C|nr:receptor-type tyrosine-protein phosphatase-like N isoform X2 [Stegostoma tigrinum]
MVRSDADGPDGLFGHCQVAMVPTRTQFDVSAAVLRRLQQVLKHLMLQGLSWQDDVTQYVISMEMEKVPKLHPQHHHLTSAPLPETRSQWQADKDVYPGAVSAAAFEQWPPSQIRRYLQLVLYGSPSRFTPDPSVKGAVLEPYLFPKNGNVYQLGPEQGRSYPKDNDQELPSDRSSSYHLDYGTTRVRHPNRVKGQAIDVSDPRPQEDVAIQRIAKELVKYGIDLRDLSDQQLNRVTGAIGQLTRMAGQPDPALMEKGSSMQKKASMMEGTMQHWKEVESRESSESLIPDPDSTQALGPPNAAAARRIQAVVATTLVGPGLSEPEAQGAAVELGRPPGQLANILEDLGLGQDPERLLGHSEDLQPGGATGSPRREEYAYIVTNKKPLSLSDGIKLLESLAHQLHLATVSFINISVIGPALTFRLRHNDQNLTVAEVADKAIASKTVLEAESGLKIVQAGVGERNAFHSLPEPARHSNTFRFLLLSFIAVACIAGILIAGAIIICLRQNAKQRQKEKLAGLGPEGGTDTSLEYQELCRQHMAAKSSYSRTETVDTSRVSSVSSQFSDAPQASPSSHNSTPSWCEEPVQSNMDISTGHMILAYMEDHLKIKDRLHKEWEALCAYQAEPNSCTIGQSEVNIKKSRNPDFVPYDHNRMVLKAEVNPSRTDFINASPIIDHDPRMPAYIATQGPLSHTISDFWQMVWENGCTVIVMLTPLVEDSVKHCDRYWPDEGSSLYHIYEVNLVSEHIWCEDFLVRSFYLKNLQSQETRTLTQFHFLSWPAEGIPSSTRPLLDFRRKVNKCYRGRSCPIIVHCSDGAGRTGTYILIDMVLNRMSKGVKEIDIAATLEHIRDQRPGMVHSKDQFEFALTAVAEEVNAILKALPQ